MKIFFQLLVRMYRQRLLEQAHHCLNFSISCDYPNFNSIERSIKIPCNDVQITALAIGTMNQMYGSIPTEQTSREFDCNQACNVKLLQFTLAS